jgi:hypothetical protein
MRKNVVMAGLLGGLVAFVWIFISNAMVPIKSRMIHKTVPGQMEVHASLEENITEPGTYSIPYLSNQEQQAYPEYRSMPVYSVTYSGYTHGYTGSIADIVVPIALIFAAAFLVSWMLSVTSPRVLSSYARRVAFVALVGVVIALSDDLSQMYLGPQPRDYLVFLAVNNVLTWFVTGLVIAWKIKPKNG